jgi:alkylation response protein AidB-like acyl-CoA dehydrogenase
VVDDARSGNKLALARHHLNRVQSAWDDPTDWDDLSLYGFYCLEAAVGAAAACVRIVTSKKHWEKADVARELHGKHGLPDIEQLLRDLNDARKAAAYGDIPAPDLNAEDVASEIERYVDAVSDLIERTAENET